MAAKKRGRARSAPGGRKSRSRRPPARKRPAARKPAAGSGGSGSGKVGDGKGVRLRELHDNLQGPRKYERADRVRFRQISKNQSDEVVLFVSTAIGLVEPNYRVVVGIRAGADGNMKAARDYAVVRCECKSYYFYYSWANMKRHCQWGDPFPKYRRKTPITDPRYPPKNPKKIPGLCKHLEKYSQVLAAKRLLK